MSVLRNFVFYVLVFFQSFAIADEDFVYLNPFDSTKFFNIALDGESITINDIEYQSSFCDQVDKYICINSSVFNFAVPRKWPIMEQTWQIGSIKYTKDRIEEIYILGRQIETIVITSKQNSATYEFLYSKSIGIVGFTVMTNDGVGTFFSVAFTGYGCQ